MGELSGLRAAISLLALIQAPGCRSSHTHTYTYTHSHKALLSPGSYSAAKIKCNVKVMSDPRCYHLLNYPSVKVMKKLSDA